MDRASGATPAMTVSGAAAATTMKAIAGAPRASCLRPIPAGGGESTPSGRIVVGWVMEVLFSQFEGLAGELNESDSVN